MLATAVLKGCIREDDPAIKRGAYIEGFQIGRVKAMALKIQDEMQRSNDSYVPIPRRSGSVGAKVTSPPI